MLIFTLLLLLLFFATYQRRKQLTIFKRLRIPGPKPNFIFGHLIDVRRDGLNKLFPKWVKKHGPIVGFYLGGRPQLLIADPELIRRVLVKDFRKFNERNQCIPGGVHPTPELQKIFIWRKYNDWKYMRASLTASFSPVKLTAMKSLMMASIDKFVSDLDDVAKGGKEFNIKPYIYEFTFSNACKCTFGIDLTLKQLTEEAKNFAKVSAPRLDRSILAIMMILFPSLTFILYPLRVFWERLRFHMSWSPEGFCYAFTKKIVQSRKDSNIKSVDFLQLLMNTKRIRSNNDIDLEMSVNDVKSNNSVAKERRGENISDDETVANTLLLLLASYETITGTLQYCVHNLMHHQNIQEELRTELRKAVSNGTAHYDVPMLNYIIKETLRIFPIASLLVSRVAAEDYEYNDIVIPKGMPIHIGVSSIHNDTTLWPDPEEFQPKRFENGYDKMSYLSFGVGPKNCIGMRLAYMELQIALAKLILNYRFEPGPSTKKKMETMETFGTLLPKDDIICKITKLEK